MADTLKWEGARSRQVEQRCNVHRCLELWDGVKFLKRIRERIGQTPCEVELFAFAP